MLAVCGHVSGAHNVTSMCGRSAGVGKKLELSSSEEIEKAAVCCKLAHVTFHNNNSVQDAEDGTLRAVGINEDIAVQQ